MSDRHRERVHRLTRPDAHGKAIHLLGASPGDAYDLATAVSLGHEAKAIARVVRGAKCRTSRGLFDEFAAAWQFPPYFGGNWDALDECLADLDWLPAATHVLVVTEADKLLAEDESGGFASFLEVLGGLGRPEGSVGSRAAFRAVLQADPEAIDALASRLSEAGASADRL